MTHEAPVQPKLNDLLARYLEKQSSSQEAGIGAYDPEVVPYEVGPVQPLDSKLAWEEALLALGSAQPPRRQVPPHWSALVANHESLVAVAFCVGNFPQMMRHFQAILIEPNLSRLRPEAGRPASLPELTQWTQTIARQGQFPAMLLALGALRLAKHFAEAEAFVLAHDAQVPAEWRAAWQNEIAALAWHGGRFEEARRQWNALELTVPVLFNRGMSALFANDIAAAKQHLAAAVVQLPETSAWHHLGQLYLTMAQLR